jgi:hypothetical protein
MYCSLIPGPKKARTHHIFWSGVAMLTCVLSAWADRGDIQDKIPDARIIYSRNGRIHYSKIKPWQPVAVTEGTGCRWSRDGRRMVYVVNGGDHRTAPSVWMADFEDGWFTNMRKVRDSAYIPEYTADSRAITFVSSKLSNGEADSYQWQTQTRIRGGKVIVKRDLATGEETVLFDSRESYADVYDDRPLFHIAQLHKNNRHLLLYSYHDMRPHKTSVFDLQTQTLLHNDMMWNGDCSPAWSGDYSFITTTREAHDGPRCVYKQEFDPETGAISEGGCFFSAPDQITGGQNHRHQTDFREEWLVCASRLNEDAKRDIWIWEIGASPQSAVNLTQSQDGDKDDCDIFVTGPDPTKTKRQPCSAGSPAPGAARIRRSAAGVRLDLPASGRYRVTVVTPGGRVIAARSGEGRELERVRLPATFRGAAILRIVGPAGYRATRTFVEAGR